MRLGTLLFAAYAVILVACLAYPVALVAQRLRLVYLESIEEPLVDTANVLAELAGHAMEDGALDPDLLYDTARRVEHRLVSARIYERLKPGVDLGVYITDVDGRVLFDSRAPANLGADFSAWRDVSLTLTGSYGARISNDPADPELPRQLYVAAPIRVRGQLAGVLTVVKPTTAVSSSLQVLRPRLFALAAIAGGVAIALSLLVSLWVRQQVGRLTRYANDVREGRRVPFPRLAKTELLEMGLAFENMRAALAGQTYVEQYVRTLTHELKSPISAIRGAAEILETPELPAAQRERFLRNVRDETERMKSLVDRMLELSELESRRALPELRKLAIAPILQSVLDAHAAQLSHRALRCELVSPEPELEVRGDAVLLQLALSNLLENAVEFSPRDGKLTVRCERRDDRIQLRIEDEGPGIPEYARERVFERFYSLTRPDTGKKSTGLGLNLVREIALLHAGQIELENRSPHGLCATLSLPAVPPRTAPH